MLWKNAKFKDTFNMDVTANQLLRFTTAGSVDDGKSTLIGRLLYDSKSIFEDQLDAVETTSRRRGHEGIDLALFTDGLKDEREQGITIDVAYRYFTTPKRKFIIADTPGHIQYTRNMVTGASTANAAIILIDARKGVVEQTKRHSYIASLLQIPHLIVCINKMDLVDFQEDVFQSIMAAYESVASKMTIKDIRYIPISALNGDNVVHPSESMNWYRGAPLLEQLENLHISSDINKIDARFPVQGVLRPQLASDPDYRAFAGTVCGGIFRKGDAVTILPEGYESSIKAIERSGKEILEAFAPLAISIQLEDDIDVSRGSMIVKQNNLPLVTQEIEAMICWFSNQNAIPRGKYTIQHTTRVAKCVLNETIYTMDVNSLERNHTDKAITMNTICRVRLRIAQPIMVDPYRENRLTGSFILIDEQQNETVAAGMII
jgi:sulfate adenylyltransferase subunit 1